MRSLVRCSAIQVFLTCWIFLLGPTAGALFGAVTYTSATTELVVYGGEANNGLVPIGGYFDYTDLATFELTTWSIDPLLVFADGSTSVLSDGVAGGLGSPTDVGGVAMSTTATGGISVSAATELIGDIARSTFTFSSASALDGTTFVFYAENDLFSVVDDAALFTGTIAGGDLELFQLDTSTSSFFVKLTGEGLSGASLSLFGAGIWTAWGTALEGGDLSVLSSDGSNFATSGDLGLALAFELSGTSASVVVDYQTTAVPEPFGTSIIASIIAGLAASRRRLKSA
jgi:hypothetical protein